VAGNEDLPDANVAGQFAEAVEGLQFHCLIGLYNERQVRGLFDGGLEPSSEFFFLDNLILKKQLPAQVHGNYG
jgi:hypothetical protein